MLCTEPSGLHRGAAMLGPRYPSAGQALSGATCLQTLLWVVLTSQLFRVPTTRFHSHPLAPPGPLWMPLFGGLCPSSLPWLSPSGPSGPPLAPCRAPWGSSLSSPLWFQGAAFLSGSLQGGAWCPLPFVYCPPVWVFMNLVPQKCGTANMSGIPEDNFRAAGDRDPGGGSVGCSHFCN